MRSRQKLLPDKFEYSHDLFAGEYKDITGRSFMLITSRCLRVLKKIPRELTNHSASTN